MLGILAGLALGVAVATGASVWPWLAGTLDGAGQGLLEAGHRALMAASAGLELGSSPGVDALMVVLTVLIPGLLCVALAEASRAAKSSRRVIGLLSVAVAVAAIGLLPPAEALIVSLTAFALAPVLMFASGLALGVPLAAVAGVIGGRTVLTLLSGTNEYVNAGALTLTDAAGGGDGLLRVALTVVALTPILGAAKMMLTGKRS